MPTYEYECQGCGRRFEHRQAITEAPLRECPECRSEVRRLVSGGAGFIVKRGGLGPGGLRNGECSLEQVGRTCCGQTERCAAPGCRGGR